MPTTPGINISDQVVWDRVMAAFHNSPAEFKAWQKQALRSEVEARELTALRDQARLAEAARSAELTGLLDSAT